MVGSIEICEAGVVRAAPPDGVDPATVKVLARRDVVAVINLADDPPHLVGLHRSHWRTEHVFRKQTRDAQGVVADLLGVEPVSRTAAIECIVRILLVPA